jgi:hypothetical protein
MTGTPFFAGLAQQGQLAYPLFGLSLTRNETGTIAIGLLAHWYINYNITTNALGAIDSSVVTNVSNIGWNQVTTFSPVNTESNASSYLQWAIPISGFAINGTQLISSPTYPTATKNRSLALFDMYVDGSIWNICYSYVLQREPWHIRSLARCVLSSYFVRTKLRIYRFLVYLTYWTEVDWLALVSSSRYYMVQEW